MNVAIWWAIRISLVSHSLFSFPPAHSKENDPGQRLFKHAVLTKSHSLRLNNSKYLLHARGKFDSWICKQILFIHCLRECSVYYGKSGLVMSSCISVGCVFRRCELSTDGGFQGRGEMKMLPPAGC